MDPEGVAQLGRHRHYKITSLIEIPLPNFTGFLIRSLEEILLRTFRNSLLVDSVRLDGELGNLNS